MNRQKHRHLGRWITRTTFCAAIAGLLSTGGCSFPPVKPVSYQQADVESWFSGAPASKMMDVDRLDYTNAKEAYKTGHYDKAIAGYRELAREGVREGAYELGKAYRYGVGVPKNPDLAAQWLMASLSGPNSQLAYASYHLGDMFLEGEGVPQNNDLARRLLEQASKNGNLQANLPLAKIYASGMGVPQNISKAEALARRAAADGNLESYVWLLQGYGPGGVLGVNRQQETAIANKVIPLLRAKATQQHDPQAMRNLAMINYDGLGKPKDMPMALHWLNQLAAEGHPKFLTNFGEHVLKGTDGFKAAPTEGFKILEPAARQYRHPEAMELVAEAYRDGLGTQANTARAEQWFKRAVDAGSVKAALEYGRMLVARENDPASMRRGVKLLQKAADQNMPYALATLGKLNVDQRFPGADPAKG